MIPKTNLQMYLQMYLHFVLLYCVLDIWSGKTIELLSIMTTKTIDKLPKKNNASNGKKAHFDNRKYKIGRIKFNSWANEILPARDIYVYESDMVHFKLHIDELAVLGMTQFDFVKFVVENFSEIRKGTGNSYLLIVRRTNVSNQAAIELVVDEKNNEIFKVNTAYAVSNKKLKSKKLLLTNDH